MLDSRQLAGETLIPVGTGADAEDVGVKQFSFRELTYQRFMRHPTAKWALLGLGILIVACYGAPLWHLVFPNYIQAPDQFSLLDAGTGPSLRHLMGTDSYNGHDIFSLVLYGGRFSIFGQLEALGPQVLDNLSAIGTMERPADTLRQLRANALDSTQPFG